MAKKARRKTSKKKAGISFFGLTARALMTLAAGLLLLSCLSLFLDPVHFWFFTIFGLLFMPLFVLNLALLIWAVMRKSKAAIIPFLAILPSLFFIGKFYQWSDNRKDSDTDGITMVSYNVGRFVQYGAGTAKDRTSCADSVVSFIKSCNADIICLQEVQIANANQVKKWIKDNFRGYNSEYYVMLAGNGAFGNITLSRFPITDKGKFDFENSTNLALYTDIDVKGKKVRIYNCHLQSYGLSASRILTSMGRNEELQKAQDKMRTSIIRRPKQVAQVLRDIRECPLETIVAGDFNDTPMSHTYYMLNKDHKDTFTHAGKGFGGTFVNFRHLLRIDYVLIPNDAEALSYEVPRVRCSDHFPVVTKFAL